MARRGLQTDIVTTSEMRRCKDDLDRSPILSISQRRVYGGAHNTVIMP
jgi:hypothetical protein